MPGNTGHVPGGTEAERRTRFPPSTAPWKAGVNCPAHVMSLRADCEYGGDKNCPLPEHHCKNLAGLRTTHPGHDECFAHAGRSSLMSRLGEKSIWRAAAMEALSGLSLSAIGDRLAREAAASAIVVVNDPEAFGRYVRAFAQAAERAEGSKLTVDARIGVLAEASDEELAGVYRELTDRVLLQRAAKRVGPGTAKP